LRVYDREFLDVVLECFVGVFWRTVLVFNFDDQFVGLFMVDNVGELVMFEMTNNPSSANPRTSNSRSNKPTTLPSKTTTKKSIY
jgi:hypothetical protein